VRLFLGGRCLILDGVWLLGRGCVMDAEVFLVVLLVYVDSYLFVSSASILQIGVGLSNNHASCEYNRRVPRDCLTWALGRRFLCAFYSILRQR